VDFPGAAKYFGIASKVADAIKWLDKVFDFINEQLNQIADALDTLVQAKGLYDQAVTAYQDAITQATQDFAAYEDCLANCSDDNGGEGGGPTVPDGGGGGGGPGAPVPYGTQPVDT